MKTKIFFLILFIVVYNTIFAQEFMNVTCYICQIDFIDDYFLIYSKNSTENKYLILSKKDNTDTCQNVEIGQSYKFTFDIPMIQPMNLKIALISPSGKRIKHDWGNDLYYALELKGLCYNPRFKEDVIKIREENDKIMREKSLSNKKRKTNKKRKYNYNTTGWKWEVII